MNSSIQEAALRATAKLALAGLCLQCGGTAPGAALSNPPDAGGRDTGTSLTQIDATTAATTDAAADVNSPDVQTSGDVSTADALADADSDACLTNIANQLASQGDAGGSASTLDDIQNAVIVGCCADIVTKSSTYWSLHWAESTACCGPDLDGIAGVSAPAGLCTPWGPPVPPSMPNARNAASALGVA